MAFRFDKPVTLTPKQASTAYDLVMVAAMMGEDEIRTEALALARALKEQATQGRQKDETQ